MSFLNGFSNLLLIFVYFRFLARRYADCYETQIIVNNIDSNYLYKIFNNRFCPALISTIYYKIKFYLNSYIELIKK
jgi:hypothetical protein